MEPVKIQLFNRFQMVWGEHFVRNLDGSKAQELFCFLLIHRDRSHLREVLAEMLWNNASPKQSRKYLRQTLWQLQSSLADFTTAQGPLVIVENDWIGLNRDLQINLDIDQFEQAFQLVSGKTFLAIDSQIRQIVQDALNLYHGDLLEGWYQDWCLFERERLQNMYLTLLDRMMAYCEEQFDFEPALAYGARILRIDRAHERTHQRLIRCLYRAGDRTAALRQFQQCEAVLREELGVQPAQETMKLYELLRNDQLADALQPGQGTGSSSDMLNYLRELQRTLARLESQIKRQMHPDSRGS